MPGTSGRCVGDTGPAPPSLLGCDFRLFKTAAVLKPGVTAGAAPAASFDSGRCAPAGPLRML